MSYPLVPALTAFALACSSTAALADLRAQDLWQSWQSSVAASGLQLAAQSAETEGQALRLAGLTLVLNPNATLNIRELTLTDTEAGDVTIIPGEAWVDYAAGRDPLQIRHNDLVITATAPAAAGVRYALRARDLTTLLPLPQRAQEGSAPVIHVTETQFIGLRGSYTDQPGALRSLETDLKADRLISTTRIKGEDPADPVARSETEGLALRGRIGWSALAHPAKIRTAAEFETALGLGLSLNFDMAQGLTRSDARAQTPVSYRWQMRSEPSEARFAFDAGGLRASAGGGAISLHLQSPALPGPLDFGLAAADFALELPVIAREVAAPYALRLALRDVTVSETGWAMIDSGRLLPRDPLQMEIDLTGTTLLDLTKINAPWQPGSPALGAVPETLSLRNVMLSLAGAEATMTGDFRFDHSGPVPHPLGSATLGLTGAEQLIDTLSALGVLTQANAGVARVMLTQLMTPAAGKDIRSTLLEGRPDGGLYVNGTRMR